MIFVCDPFMLYAMECEGDMPTRRGQLNQAVKRFVEYIHCTGDTEVPYDVVNEILDSCGLCTLTQDEENYIIAEIDSII